MNLDKKVIVVTGGTRGIGRNIAEKCALAGAKVVICSRKEKSVWDTINDFNKRKLKVSGIKADVSKVEELKELYEHAINKWKRIDVWINNAGLSGVMKPLDELSSKELNNIIDVNLRGTMEGCRLIIPYFRTHGGVLINMSGMGGRLEAAPYLAPYALTKAAVTSLTKSLARENREYPISIHSVMPGMVETDLIRVVETTPKLEHLLESIPYVLKAFGVPVDVVGSSFVKIAAQKPGKVSGKNYSLLKGWRLFRGICRISWYRVTGKIKGGY